MKYTNILFENLNDIKSNKSINEFVDKENCLVRIYVSSSDTNLALSFAKEIRNKLPLSHIIGVATDGILYEGEIHEDRHLISITSFEKAVVYTKLLSSKGMRECELGKEISQYVNSKGESTVFLFLGNENKHIQNICQYLNDNSKNSSFTGGVSGYLNKKTGEVTCYVFNDKELIQDGFVLAGIAKEYILSYSSAVVGHQASSEIHTITKMDDVFIAEIDNQDANTWMRETLGIKSIYGDKEKSIENDMLIQLPFVLEGEDGSSRILAFEEKTQKYTANYTLLNENQEFRVGFLSVGKTSEEWQNICLDLQDTSVEYVFMHSCLYRRIYLENLSKKEMLLFKDDNIAGAFLRGEIGTKNNCTRYYNGTCSIITLAQKEKYLNINYDAFKVISDVNDNEKLAERLNKIDKVETIQNQIIEEITHERKTDNYEKNMLDFVNIGKKDEYSKICVITNKVIDDENNEVVGTKQKEISRNILSSAKLFLDTEYPEVNCDFYRYNKRSFFLVINEIKNDAKVIEITQSLYNYLNQIISNEKSLHIFNSMTIALKVERISKLISNQASLVGQENKNSFNIFSEKDQSLSLQEEFELVADLKEVIAKENVMPYIQGIYDNVNGGFYAYEVIMRLMASSGEVLFPEHFLETAKKYDIYLDLSYILVSKVLDFAKNRDEKILINLSVKDIESNKFSRMVFEKLAIMENPKNIVFEVCDLSDISNIENLKLFLFKLDKLNMKFAVDNFEISDFDIIREAELNINYLKITSSYLSDVVATKQAENIFTISKKLKAELMVKHVETAAMQKQVLVHSIKYTQGFFFSRPVSIDEAHAMNEAKPDELDVESDELTIDDASIKTRKKSSMFIYIGIVAFIVLSLIATITFTKKNAGLVSEMNDTFLTELATGLSAQVRVQIEDAQEFLLLANEFVTSDGYTLDAMQENLKDIDTQQAFDGIYLSFGGAMPINSDNEELDINLDNIYGVAERNNTSVSSPVIDENTGRELFVISTPIFNGSNRVGETYGVYYLDEFSDVLNLTVFGGEAFFHLCEVDGTPIVISGDDNNLFEGGNMYNFISSLEMSNDNTVESIQMDMENSVPVLLKYTINNQERTAVMLRIHGTDWCVISILLDDIIGIIQSDIDSSTFNFVVFVFIMVIIYSLLLIELERRNNKALVKALESSKLLASSLQTNIEMDSLTRTFSRSAIEEKITHIITKPQEKEKNAVVLLDVDNFKSVNDTYGHKTGDIYLQELTSAVKKSLRGGDIIGRIGGDEFVILLNDIVDLEVTKSILTRILANVNKIEIKGVSLDEVSISAGVAIVPKDGIEYDEISTKADKALYLAKLAGKNKFMIYDEL